MHPTKKSYPCSDEPEIAEGCYGRLCHGAAHDEKLLHQLALRMKDSDAKRQARANTSDGIATMPSGLVYFGQFIDHDVTRDITRFEQATPNVGEIRNYRTPKLDLDHLYGKNPAAVPCIYDRDHMHLAIGWTLEAKDEMGQTIASSQ